MFLIFLLSREKIKREFQFCCYFNFCNACSGVINSLFLSVFSYSIKLLAVQELADREALEKVFKNTSNATIVTCLSS